MLLTLIVEITEEQTVYCLPNFFSRRKLKTWVKDCFYDGKILAHNEDFLEKRLNSAINHTNILTTKVSVKKRLILFINITKNNR